MNKLQWINIIEQLIIFNKSNIKKMRKNLERIKKKKKEERKETKRK